MWLSTSVDAIIAYRLILDCCMVSFEHVMSNNMRVTRVFTCMPAMVLVKQLVYVSVSLCAKTQNF